MSKPPPPNNLRQPTPKHLRGRKLSLWQAKEQLRCAIETLQYEIAMEEWEYSHKPWWERFFGI